MSEMPEEFLKYLLEHILPNCHRIAIIDTSVGRFFSNIISFINTYFQVLIAPCDLSGQTDHNLYFSNKKRMRTYETSISN